MITNYKNITQTKHKARNNIPNSVKITNNNKFSKRN